MLSHMEGFGNYYCNNFNSTPKEPLEALRRSGANRTQTILYGVLPQAFPEMVSFTMTNYECCLRSSTIMSFAVVTFAICETGLYLGKTLGTKLAGKADILGGVILIGIGIEIFVKGVFF